VGSRRDLQRLHTWMCHRRIVARALRSVVNGQAPRGIVELGAGDGRFMLRVARQLSSRWPGACVTLVDQQETVTQETRQAFEALGWGVKCLMADVFDWIEQPWEQGCGEQTFLGKG